MARSRSDSCTTLGRTCASRIRRPASTASSTPRPLSGTSVQPVKRFSRFQVLSPWRRRTSVPGLLAVPIDLSRDLHNMRKLRGVEARAADEAAVAVRELDVRLHVARVDAASIEDPHLARRTGTD